LNNILGINEIFDKIMLSLVFLMIGITIGYLFFYFIDNRRNKAYIIYMKKRKKEIENKKKDDK
jgi:uncharacterized membrane-anchored protein YhcB (DUF1043 family)